MVTRGIEEADVPACISIFNEAFNDVHRAYGFDEDAVDEDDSWLAKPLGHFLNTDPDGGLIVTDDDGAVAFGSSIARDDYRLLAFLSCGRAPRGEGSDDSCSDNSFRSGTGSHSPRWPNRSRRPRPGCIRATG
jgi:hypothetical protein